MTLDQLRIFVAVAEREHMTRAAHSLDLAQSAVSKAITSLESEVGFSLFDRVGRNIRLTESGAACREEARALLALADRLVAWAVTRRAQLAAGHAAVPLQPTPTQQAQARDIRRAMASLAGRVDRSLCEIDRIDSGVAALGRETSGVPEWARSS